MYRPQSKFGHVFDIHPRVFAMDANACGSPDMKALKAAVAEIKASIVEVRLSARTRTLYLILRNYLSFLLLASLKDIYLALVIHL